MKYGGKKDNWVIARNLPKNISLNARFLHIEHRRTPKGEDWPVAHLIIDGSEFLMSMWSISSDRPFEEEELKGHMVELVKISDSNIKLNLLPQTEFESI